MFDGLHFVYFSGHDGSSREVLDLADGASIAGAELLQDLELLWPQIQLVLDANLQLLVSAVAVPAKVVVSAVLSGRRGFGSRGRQGKALDVLALH